MKTDNIEPIARAICEQELRSSPQGVSETELPDLLNRYWPVIAAEIASGLRDEDGVLKAHTASDGVSAWETWLDEHPGEPRTRD